MHRFAPHQGRQQAVRPQPLETLKAMQATQRKNSIVVGKKDTHESTAPYSNSFYILSDCSTHFNIPSKMMQVLHIEIAKEAARTIFRAASSQYVHQMVKSST